jgi:5-formyltetrahydrofolate cyclo-ligase
VNNKPSLRRQLLRQRRELSPEIWREWSDRICAHLLNSPQFQSAKTILVYQSCNQEPDLSYLFTHADKQWGLPRCVGKDLIWHRWQTSEPLVTGAYGILEPAPELPYLEQDSIDLMLVPSVAIDRAGYRLGYGGGYYDRLRADPLWRKVPTIGITFDFSSVELLPIDPWDICLDAICTESGMSFNLIHTDFLN